MNNKNKKSSWLYKDKKFEKELTAEEVMKYLTGNSSRPFYFYDGGNGDKHLLTGAYWDYNENMQYVQGVNLSQCHAVKSGFGDTFKNVSELAERFFEKTQNEIPREYSRSILKLLQDVRTYTWRS